MHPLTPRRAAGFGLLELMLALAVLAILLGLAQTTFRQQLMKARRTEAIVGLQGILRSQQAYHVAQGIYGDTFDEIGFSLDGGRRIDARTIEAKTYTFEVRALPFDDDPRGNFQALATGDLDPGDGVLDILLISNHLTVLP